MMMPKLQLNTEEKLLLETGPCRVYAFYLIIAKGWTWIVSAIILLFLLDSQGVTNLLQGWGIGNIAKIKLGLLLVLVVFVLLSYLWFDFFNRCHRYYFTDERCIYDYKFLGTEHKMLPYSRIFNVEVKQNFLQTLLNIASIYINTQNVSDPNFMATNFPLLKGLPKSTAENIAQIVSSRVPKV